MKSQNMKILIVDDSQMIRRIIRKELEEGGYIVDEVENGIEAIAYSSLHTPPDLITLDIEMPGLNGLQTCERLRSPRYASQFKNRSDRKIPIIFITGNDTIEDRKTGYKLGAADFISKPFAKGDILAAVNKILKPDNRLNGMTALVVDDNNMARHIVTDVLKREGLEVIEAADGEAAFDIICKKMASIDLVISDFIMPKMQGEELCRKIRNDLKMEDIPIIILTAMSDQSELLRLYKAGATDYLLKPFVKEELLARLNAQLERTQLYKRLRESINNLRSLNKMKDDLLAVCSHDLRTPLNGILGFADALLEKQYIHDDDREGLGYIKTSGMFLLELINDILDLSKIQADKSPLQTSIVSAFDIAQTCVNALKYQASSKKQKIELIDNTTNHFIHANISGMVRVINNFLSNAIKFTPEGGAITITLRNAEPNQLQIQIKDTGIGIPKDKIPHLFDKFTKTSQDGTQGEKGTGLGMSIIKEILSKHDGTVEVTSEIGKGTCFTIILPQCNESTEKKLKAETKGLKVETKNLKAETKDLKAETKDLKVETKNLKAETKNLKVSNESVPALEDGQWLKQLSVLVAEDNDINQKVAQSLFNRGSIKIDLAKNGEIAIDMIKRKAYDIVFMDMQMPILDGLDATKYLRADEQFKNLIIIAMTANDSDEDRQKCTSVGMNDYVTKPIKWEHLIELLKKWCKKNQKKSELKEPETPKDQPKQETPNEQETHILIVDDNIVNAIYATRVVEKLGYKSTTVNNGQEAFEATQNNRFNLILMDINMPVVNGIEATEKIRKTSDIPIIAVTADATLKNKDRCMAAGVNEFLAKPYTPSELSEAIKRNLSKKILSTK